MSLGQRVISADVRLFIVRSTALTVALLFSAGAALAGTFTVTNTNPSGAGSLPDAITQANAGAGPHTINITVSGMVSLTTPLVLTQSMTINGPVATTPLFSIDGASATQLIQVSPSAAGPMTLNNLALTHGGINMAKGGAIDVPAGHTLNLTNCVVAASSTFGTSSSDFLIGAGGAVTTLGTLNIQSCTFSSNTSSGPGGAIYAGPTAALTITASLITANRGGTFAGAIYCDSTTAVAITNSTFSFNQSGSGGAGAIAITNSRAVVRGSTFTGNTTLGAGGAVVTNAAPGQSIGIENSTMSENTADFGGAIYAQLGTTDLRNVTITANVAKRSGGFDNPGGSTVALRNTIVAGNTATSAESSPDCSGPVISSGYNLIQNTQGCSGLTATDLTGNPPALGGLGNNGGPTQTHAPFGSSIAVEAGNPAGCLGLAGTNLTVDQRGQPRPFGARCDIGAVEIQTTSPIPPRHRAAGRG